MRLHRLERRSLTRAADWATTLRGMSTHKVLSLNGPGPRCHVCVCVSVWTCPAPCRNINHVPHKYEPQCVELIWVIICECSRWD